MVVDKNVPNTFSSGVNTNFSTELNTNYSGLASSLLTHYDADQTSQTSSTGLTLDKIGEVTITANEVTNGILVLAGGEIYTSYNGGTITTVNLYVGNSATMTSNDVIKTIVRVVDSDASNNTGNGWTVANFVTAADFTGDFSSDVYVQIGSISDNSSQFKKCDYIEVLYL